jgi:hypothetical protein
VFGLALIKWRAISGLSDGCESCVLGRDWAFVAESGVPSAGVVEAVDVGFDVSYSLASGFVNRALDQLGFDGSKHSFDHGVVIAIAFA